MSHSEKTVAQWTSSKIMGLFSAAALILMA